jgi:hypothetical protein
MALSIMTPEDFISFVLVMLQGAVQRLSVLYFGALPFESCP